MKLGKLKLGETKVFSFNEEYLSNYGPKGYARCYRDYGFDLEKIISDFKSYGISPKYILDAGCGPGNTVLDFRKHDYVAFGIEIGDIDFVRQAVPFCIKGDIRRIKNITLPNSMSATDVDCLFCNSLMYLTESEIDRFLGDTSSVPYLYVVNPYSDIPSTVCKDKYRKMLKPRDWWIKKIEDFGRFYKPKTDSLFLRKHG